MLHLVLLKTLPSVFPIYLKSVHFFSREIFTMDPPLFQRRKQKDFLIFLNNFREQIDRHSRALVLGVYRGKISEGLSLSDHYIRGVICIGIPYPNVKSQSIIQKLKFNDNTVEWEKKEKQMCSVTEYNDSNHLFFEDHPDESHALTHFIHNCSGEFDYFLLSNGVYEMPLCALGKQWYQLQAFQALNQAMGRVIRHKKDSGVIILLDSRHTQRPLTFYGRENSTVVNDTGWKQNFCKWLHPFLIPCFVVSAIVKLEQFFKKLSDESSLSVISKVPLKSQDVEKKAREDCHSTKSREYSGFLGDHVDDKGALFGASFYDPHSSAYLDSLPCDPPTKFSCASSTLNEVSRRLDCDYLASDHPSCIPRHYTLAPRETQTSKRIIFPISLPSELPHARLSTVSYRISSFQNARHVADQLEPKSFRIHTPVSNCVQKSLRPSTILYGDGESSLEDKTFFPQGLADDNIKKNTSQSNILHRGHLTHVKPSGLRSPVHLPRKVSKATNTCQHTSRCCCTGGFGNVHHGEKRGDGYKKQAEKSGKWVKRSNEANIELKTVVYDGAKRSQLQGDVSDGVTVQSECDRRRGVLRRLDSAASCEISKSSLLHHSLGKSSSSLYNNLYLIRQSKNRRYKIKEHRRSNGSQWTTDDNASEGENPIHDEIQNVE